MNYDLSTDDFLAALHQEDSAIEYALARYCQQRAAAADTLSYGRAYYEDEAEKHQRRAAMLSLTARQFADVE